MLWSVGNEGMEDLPYAMLRHAAGVRFVRLMVNWDSVGQVPGEFDWSRVDRQVKLATEAGMQIYLNLLWAPAHASGGVPAYEQYTKGCTGVADNALVQIQIVDGPVYVQPDNGGRTRLGARPDFYICSRGGRLEIPAPGVLANDSASLQSVTKDSPKHGTMELGLDGSLSYQHDGSPENKDSFRYWVWGLTPTEASGIHFDWETHNWCRYPPPLDQDKLMDMVRRMVRRYGAVQYFGVWNEPEYGIYYPPRDWSRGEHAPNYERLFSEVYEPFRYAVRLESDSAHIVGPDTGSLEVLQRVLKYEQLTRQPFDVLSFHAYSWGLDYPGAALDRLRELLTAAGTRRPLWLSETAPDSEVGSDVWQEEMLDMARAMLAEPRVELVNFHQPLWSVSFALKFRALVRQKQRAVNRLRTPGHRA